MKIPKRVRDAEKRRKLRELITKSSFGCPTGDCDHLGSSHEGKRCEVPGCTCGQR